MNPMTEDLLQGGAADNMRPAASLTSSMIKRRRPVRVATPEDAESPKADAPAKAAQELAARVEAAFPGEPAPSAPAAASTQAPAAPGAPQAEAQKQNGTHVETDSLQARQQELRRLAAERAEAQRRPLGQTEKPGDNSGESPAGHQTTARAPQLPQNLRQDPGARRDQDKPPAQSRPRAVSDASAIQEIDALRNGRQSAQDAPGARRRSLVQGGMTALERRRAALEHHRKLTEAKAPDAAEPRDVATYWDELRRGRQVPSMIDVDPHVVAQHWPNSLLISCDDMNGAATLERSFAEVMRGARERAASHGEVVVEYTPMVTEWIMTVGREVARAGRPIQDIEVFPTSLGNVSYRVIALPLSGERLGTVHALCYISHA